MYQLFPFQKNYSVINKDGTWPTTCYDPLFTHIRNGQRIVHSKFALFTHKYCVNSNLSLAQMDTFCSIVSHPLFILHTEANILTKRTRKSSKALEQEQKARQDFESMLRSASVDELCSAHEVHRVPKRIFPDVAIPQPTKTSPKSTWYLKACALCGPCNSDDRVMWICCGVTACRTCACKYYNAFCFFTCPWCDQVLPDAFDYDEILPRAPRVTTRVSTEVRTRVYNDTLRRKGEKISAYVCAFLLLLFIAKTFVIRCRPNRDNRSNRSLYDFGGFEKTMTYLDVKVFICV